MTKFNVFISYSHADEWLKNEFITHLAALKRKDIISVWHDRMIPAGGILKDEIDQRLAECDLFVMLISTDFINSDYCYQKEYGEALKRRDAGSIEVVPVIVRDCDWDIDRLKSFNALPPDAIPVTRGAISRPDVQGRDAAWLSVVTGLKSLIEEIKKKAQPPSLNNDYIDRLFIVDNVRHPSVANFDERLIFIDPDIYYENKKEQVHNFEKLVEIVTEERATLFVGGDRSGKTLIAKRLQYLLDAGGFPTVKLNGKSIKNADVERLINLEFARQYNSLDYPLSRITVIVDDFDECILPDNIKESIINFICGRTKRCVLISFSNAPAVLFTSNELPNPAIMKINQLRDSKLLDLVRKWKSVGLPADKSADDDHVLPDFEKLQIIFNQTELEKYAFTAVTFLELIESSTGSDLTFSSFASCYDALITNRLIAAGINWRSIDEAKNFMSFIAYRCYSEFDQMSVDPVVIEECLQIFKEQFFSDSDALRKIVPHFLHLEDNQYSFKEDYVWYFLCARYVVKFQRFHDSIKYNEFVSKCTDNIFLKRYANIVIYIAYFSSDNHVIDSLLKITDKLFSKADNWLLSDDSRELMLGIQLKDQLLVQAKSDVKENRVNLLNEKISDIIHDAERVVARYTLPFLSANIDDSSYVDNMDRNKIDADSYMRSVNALLRIHSVIGQILASRSGTFSANFVLDCITRMVKASGRYASLNHSIATVLIYDKETAIEDVASAIKGDRLTNEEKFDKVVSIFSFWSVYLSHAGLARYLSQDHSIRAIQSLIRTNENIEATTEEGNIPYNFTVVYFIANLYNTGKIDKRYLSEIIEKYGEHSGILSIIRVVIHIYAYYMPLTIEDKQWISNKLHMPLQKIEIQRLKAVDLKKLSRSSHELTSKSSR